MTARSVTVARVTSLSPCHDWNRVYSVDAISPTIIVANGGHMHMIAVPASVPREASE